jgi:5-hydroxyisourate hydrolase
MGASMKSVSTHVLDIARGLPAANVPITIERKDGDAFVRLHQNPRTTDADGRVKDLVPEGQLTTGTYRITFDTGTYFNALGTLAFYPEASVVFVVRDDHAHYHVPLLLSAFGYSTYRGS